MTIPEGFPFPPAPPVQPPASSGPWRYAQVNDDGVCTSVTEAAGPLEGDHLVRVESLDTAVLGQVWDGESWSAGLAPPNPTEWFIDIGPFFDRFGAAKMPVLLSASPVVQAVLRDVQVRKWIDLRRADVLAALVAIQAAVPALTEELVESILTTPVAPEENLALRVQFFGGTA